MNVSPDSTQLFDTWSLPVMMLDRDLCFVYGNKAYLNAVHKNYDEIDGVYVFDAFPESEERVEAVLKKFRRTLKGEVTKLDAQPFQLEMEDGSMSDLVWQATQDPIRDRSGKIIGLIQRAEDITEQHKLEQRNKAISYELSHRVKNIMAVVNSVARITGRTADNVQDFVKNFTARVSAMSRTHDLLALGNWTGLDVASIFEDELRPYFEEQGNAFSLTGPSVRLSIEATKDLSMVCHELATNAAKYGCLGKSGGDLHVNWSRRDDILTIHWRETCPHTVQATDKIGFGTRLFDMLPYVRVEREFTETGLNLTITMDGDSIFA